LRPAKAFKDAVLK